MGLLFSSRLLYTFIIYKAAPKETVACTTFSSPAYLKNFNDLSVFPYRVVFQWKSVAKVSTFFHSTKTFFKFFSGSFFRGGRTAARRIPPEVGKDASLSSFRGFRSRKRMQKYALYPILQHTPHTFFHLFLIFAGNML